MTEKNSNPTQADDVLAFMRKHGSITHRQAEDYLGCMRLAARISELRHKRNEKIKSEIIPVKAANGRIAHIARYSLI